MGRHTSTRPGRGRASHGRQPKRERQDGDEIPAVYQEMLAEAEARDPAQFHSDRPIKRRRAGDMKAVPVDSQPLDQPNTAAEVKDGAQQVQTVYETLSSDESDVEWEDVDLQQPVPSLPSAAPTLQGDHETLQITLDQEPEKRKKTVPRRKPVSAAERKLRLDVHEVHLLCLLGHVHLRNLWCNDEEVQGFLKKMLPKNVRMLLNPSEDKPYYVRSTTFMDGLNQAGDIFNRRFRVTKLGLKRAHWAEDHNQLKHRMESIMADAEVILSKDDFRTQAKILQGSRDFGAQLFCALLRSVAVEARLVCSLQPLPFSGTVKDMTPIKAKSQYIVISDDNETSTDQSQKPGGSPTPAQVRRLAQPQFSRARSSTSTRSGPRPILQESSYPVFWVEAFNEAAQKWITIDPMVTKSLAKPLKLEPPASDPYNSMSYVVAFEDDASVRDVTRRYVKAFNAKTRKLRVESTRHGDEWWEQTMRAYEKPFLEDRDEAEISELTSKSAAEPMPRNIQDFKDHPIYALERHLRRNEVIFPKRGIGHVGLSKTTAKSDNLEPVYRRSDVHVARSADKWYRLGRDVKVGEQPLKHVPARRDRTGFLSDEEDNEPEETALYAEFQTELYHPPPVVQGKIPKNVYGNLDVYVPSMVPSGAVHIEHPEAARAARILGIDYADAVTGFEFKGRRGTAIIRGIVIALEYQEAIHEVLRSIEDERWEAVLEARSAEVLRIWRLFLVKLRIAERVKGYMAEDEEEAEEAGSEMSVDAIESVEEAGGGFLPDPGQPTPSPPLRLFGKDKFVEKALSLDASENAPVMASGLDAETLGGGFVLDEPMDESPTVAPAANNPPSAPRKNKARASDGSRYHLVVVPNHDSDAFYNPEPKATAEAQPKKPEEAGSRNDDVKGSSEKLPISVDSSAHDGSASASVEALSRQPSPRRAQHHSLVPDTEPDSEIEKGSLMSEDPEDEDAIPEWLMSD